jgi:hypothetical protein
LRADIRCIAGSSRPPRTLDGVSPHPAARLIALRALIRGGGRFRLSDAKIPKILQLAIQCCPGKAIFHDLERRTHGYPDETNRHGEPAADLNRHQLKPRNRDAREHDRQQECELAVAERAGGARDVLASAVVQLDLLPQAVLAKILTVTRDYEAQLHRASATT